MNKPNLPPEMNPTAGTGKDTGQAEGNGAVEELEQLRVRAEERDRMLDLLQRTQADFENYQKRAQREREQERRYQHRGLALDLLPALDNLERALAEAQRAGEGGAIVQGVNLVLTQLLDTLKKHGITRIEALGQPFDPNLHQAMMQQPASAGYPPHTVVQVLEHGYMIHDRVLRPARVVVTAPQQGG